MTRSLTSNVVALMVDDDGYANHMYEEIMSWADIDVTVVPDSDRALRAIEAVNISKGPLDVFITDHSHPGLPGPELIKRIRALPDEMTSCGGLRLRHIPIVVHSASQQPDQIKEIDPTIPCLLKPTSIEELP